MRGVEVPQDTNFLTGIVLGEQRLHNGVHTHAILMNSFASKTMHLSSKNPNKRTCTFNQVLPLFSPPYLPEKTTCTIFIWSYQHV